MTYPLSPHSCLLNSANHHYHSYCKTQNYVAVILQLITHTSVNILTKPSEIQYQFVQYLVPIYGNIVFSPQS